MKVNGKNYTRNYLSTKTCARYDLNYHVDTPIKSRGTQEKDVLIHSRMR